MMIEALLPLHGNNASKHQSIRGAEMPRAELIRVMPTVEYLRECFDYDPKTGELRWRLRPSEHFVRRTDEVRCNAMSGEIAGYFDNGYRRVSLKGFDYKAHRIIWKWMTGNDPSLMLDHKDGNRANNRWENLREATQGEQTQNSKLRVDNPHQQRGVYQTNNGKKWIAIVAGRYLGRFKSFEEASAAYEKTAHSLFGEFYRQPHER